MVDAWYDQAAADKACLFFEKLVHVEGPKGGQPFTLEPWQRVIVRRLFGWKDGRDAGLRFLYLEVPRGNGKVLLAGLGMYMLFCKEHGAEVCSCALDGGMASLVYEPAKAMVARCPMLAKRAKSASRRTDRGPVDGLVLPAAPGNESIGHGFNVHFFCYDELRLAKTRHLYDAMVTAMGKRKQPIGRWPTPPAATARRSVGNALHALDVIRDPSVDPRMLAVIYTADPETTGPAKKSSGRPIRTWAFRSSSGSSAERASRPRLRPRPSKASFHQLHLNRRTDQDIHVIQLDAWRACARPSLPMISLRTAFLPSRPGLDMAGARDVTAFVELFEELLRGGLAWMPARLGCPKGSGDDRRPAG